MPPKLKPHGSVWNPRTITAPVAAITMAFLLYTYSVTSIRAAKRNAQLHREADGGQLDMRRESLRRHGALEQVQGTSGVQLFREARKMDDERGMAEADEGRERTRTKVEDGLEDYKGVGNAVRRFKDGIPPPKD